MEVTMTVGWGIIGLGRFVGRFTGPALRTAADTRVVAVCSRSMEKAKSYALEHGVERAYDSFAKMLEDPALDAIYIATPNILHPELTIQAAEAGKHILCEKPMAITVAECERMIEACEKHHVKLGVDFQNRYHPAHVAARRLIETGEIGDILVTRAQYCHGHMQPAGASWRNDLSMAGAGALVGTGVHPIDLLRFLLDSEVEEVRALCEPQGSADRQCYIILEFKNGARGVVITGILAPRSDNDAVLYGTKAKVTCKGTVGMPMQGELLVEGESINTRMTFPSDDLVPGCYVRVIEAFNRWITDDIEPKIPGRNGLQMVKIVNAILESSREGKAVRIDS